MLGIFLDLVITITIEITIIYIYKGHNSLRNPKEHSIIYNYAKII